MKKENKIFLKEYRIDSKRLVVANVPYDLKNNLRENFPSAKWDPSLKVWHVGKRCKKRLERWIDEVQECAELIAIKDHKEFNEREIERLKEKISNKVFYLKNLINEKDSIEKQTKQQEKMNKVLSGCDEKIAKVKDEIIHRKHLKQNELEKTKDFLNEIVDVGYVFLLADKMHSIMRQRIVYAKDKDRYREYYSELSEIDDDLQKAGFRSEYIDKVLDVNVNRPDRDDISKIDVSKIYNLEKIEADEDKPDN